MTTTASDPAHNRQTRRPFGGKKRLYNVVRARFRTNFIQHDFDARQLQLRIGDEVIVETSRGPAIAEVCGHVHRKVLTTGELDRVLRKANDQDVRHAQKNEERELDAYRFCIERIRARNLPMKLVRAQYMHDGSKIVFFFSADGRIDFRDLVKDLAHRFRTRIEMHQIGIRDGTRMLGGIGPCGRELCCSTFLEHFHPVSIRMAKAQGLTLNPAKVSGMCGRLMCCLVYEQQMYKRMRKSLPRAGQWANTDQGGGKIVDLDVVNRRVTIQFPDQNKRIFAVEDIEVVDKNKLDETVDAASAHRTDGYLWEKSEVSPVEFVGFDDDGAKTKRKSRRRRSRKRKSKDKSKSEK